MSLAPEQVEGIRERVRKGRMQGGNPKHGGEPFALYVAALDDLETLLGYHDETEERFRTVVISAPPKPKRKTKKR